MSVDVVDAGDQLDEWDDAVEASPDATLFHRSDALEIQATHSESRLHALMGFKGQEPVGLFPLFEQRRGPLTAVFSPPPPLWIHRLGPAFLNVAKLKPRTAERRKRRFVEGCLDWIDETCDPHFLRVKTVASVVDARPFKWAGADVTPEYTYVVDLTPDREEIMSQFSSDARRNVRNATDERYTVAVGDADEAQRILDHVERRYDSQDRSFLMPDAFARDLFARLPEGAIRPYTLRVDGEYASGILAYEDEHRIHRWHGGAKPEIDSDLPVNDLLDWHLMTDAKDRGLREYDLVGADDAGGIASYKAKFAPELEPFYSVEMGSRPVRALAGVYEKTRSKLL